MEARDIYRFINEQDDNIIQRIIERLEFRGKDPTFKGWNDSFVVVIAHTLMSHLVNPLSVIQESARIVRPNCHF